MKAGIYLLPKSILCYRHMNSWTRSFNAFTGEIYFTCEVNKLDYRPQPNPKKIYLYLLIYTYRIQFIPQINKLPLLH